MSDTAFAFPKFEMPALKGVDAESLMVAQRRNMEAVTSASQILVDGVRTFGQRQAEIVQARFTDLAKSTETMMKPNAAEPAAGLDAMKHSYEQAITDVRELLEIMVKAQADAMQVMNSCILANLEDMKKMSS